MSISTTEQVQIQGQIDDAGSADLQRLRDEAEDALELISIYAGMRGLTGEENRQAEWAIEVLVRLEATEKGKGSFFRAKRRAQLVIQYIAG
jgi:hypothetical protein